MNKNTELVRVENIRVVDRLREDYGDIAGLAESIQTHGLLHPLTIDQGNRLIAGERRLRAMKQLGFVEVECRRFHLLSESERREIELEENLRRKDLTAYERSKNVAELAEVAEIVDRETGEIIRADSAQKPGRPKGSEELGSTRRISERTGIPDTTIREAKKHVAAADNYPFLQRPEWKQYRAMEAAEALNRIPEPERKAVEELVSEPGIDPNTATKIISNLASKPAPERKQILDLAKSEDERDRLLAKTKAVELPPMPDGRATQLEGVIRTLNACIRSHPDDPEADDLRRIVNDIKILITTIRERHKDRVEAAA